MLTTSVTNSSFLTALYVVFVPIITVLIYRRNPHWIVWPGDTMMLIGIFLLSEDACISLTKAGFFSIICAFFWAVQITLAGHVVMTSNGPLALSCAQFSVCVILSMLIDAAFELTNYQAIAASISGILYVGLVSSGLAFFTSGYWPERYAHAPQPGIFLSFEALFGALFASMFLGEIIPAAGYHWLHSSFLPPYCCSNWCRSLRKDASENLLKRAELSRLLMKYSSSCAEITRNSHR